MLILQKLLLIGASILDDGFSASAAAPSVWISSFSPPPRDRTECPHHHINLINECWPCWSIVLSFIGFTSSSPFFFDLALAFALDLDLAFFFDLVFTLVCFRRPPTSAVFRFALVVKAARGFFPPVDWRTVILIRAMITLCTQYFNSLNRWMGMT